MEWSQASQSTGFAYRYMAQGKVSIKAKTGRQWTVMNQWQPDTEEGIFIAEEIKKQYQHMADKFDTWQPLSPDSEYLVPIVPKRQPTKAEDSDPRINLDPVKKPIRGLKESIRVANLIKTELLEETEALNDATILEDRFMVILNRIIEKSLLLKEML